MGLQETYPYLLMDFAEKLDKKISILRLVWLFIYQSFYSIFFIAFYTYFIKHYLLHHHISYKILFYERYLTKIIESVIWALDSKKNTINMLSLHTYTQTSFQKWSICVQKCSKHRHLKLITILIYIHLQRTKNFPWFFTGFH